MPSIRAIVRQLAPLAAVDGVVTLQEVVDGSLTRAAATRSCRGSSRRWPCCWPLGIYSLLAYAVSLRTHEIGLRMAPGLTVVT